MKFTDNPVKTTETPSKAFSVEKVRESYHNAYKPWTQDDDTELLGLRESGASMSKIASHFQRKPGAIASRLKKLLGTDDIGDFSN